MTFNSDILKHFICDTLEQNSPDVLAVSKELVELKDASVLSLPTILEDANSLNRAADQMSKAREIFLLWLLLNILSFSLTVFVFEGETRRSNCGWRSIS